MKNHAHAIGLGTAAIGRPQYINIRNAATPDFSIDAFRQHGIKILDAAYEQGIRYFDTAPGYGLAEQLLIDWVKGKQDSSIEIATKWGYTYVANFDANASQHEVKEHSLNKLNEQWEQSKALLPLLTTYQIHSATLDTGVLENEKILHRLAQLKNQYGLLIGLSSTGDNQTEIIEKAMNIEINGIPLFDVYQVTYNIFDQSTFSVLKKLAAQNKRLVIKEALANGRVFPNSKFPNYSKAYQGIQLLANAHQVGIDAIALRFCIDSLPSFKVLSGVANMEHLSSNLKTSQFVLNEKDIDTLKGFAVDPQQYWEERKLLGWN